MKFHIITNVWGERYVDHFLSLTLPNLFSQGNLPEVVRQGNAVYRIFTTAEDQLRIERHPSFKHLKQHCEVEILTPLGDREPGVEWHVHWFHRSAAEAKLSGACPIFIPPDTIWSNGSLGAIAKRLTEGYVGVACPFVMVTAETILPEFEDLISDDILMIEPHDAVKLATDHLHPLHILAMDGAPHGRPAFEMHWPNFKHGILSRYAVRELVAFDPHRCPITYLWYAGGEEKTADLFFSSDSNEMLMFSVDPIGKYFQNYIPKHNVDAIDLARTTLHPLNDTQQTRAFIRKSVNLHGTTSPNENYGLKQKATSLAAIEMETARRFFKAIYELEVAGATEMASLLAIAAFETNLLRRWRSDAPIHAIAYKDSALTQTDRKSLATIASPGNENQLVAFIQGLVFKIGDEIISSNVPLPAGQRAAVQLESASAISMEEHFFSENIAIEGVTIWLIDHIEN